MYQKPKEKKKKHFYCPKCNNEITWTMGRGGERDYCDKCQWEGKVCRKCGKEMFLRNKNRTKIKQGKKVRIAIPKYGYKCKECERQAFRRKQMKAKEKQRRR